MKNWNELEKLIDLSQAKISKVSEGEMSLKPTHDKWSKKEILGHLIDSARYNLQRFTEVRYIRKPYQITTYNQTELVTSNGYQEIETERLISFWVALNRQIDEVINKYSQEILKYECTLSDGETLQLHELVDSYIDHMKYHLNQIVEE